MSDKKKLIGFKYAWAGIVNVFKSERNFRIHLLIGSIVLIFSFLLNLSTLEWLVIVLVIGFVLVAEMFNSSIEYLLDYLNPATHPMAKLIKDISAGAVFISAITAVIIGLIIFIPKLYNALY